MASKEIFGFPKVTGYFTAGGGSWLSDYPLANLAFPVPLSQVARSTNLDAGSTVITLTSEITRRVGLIHLAGHNFSLDAQIRTRLYTDAAMLTDPLVDTGYVDVWPEVYPWDDDNGGSSLEWEDDNFWTGKYLDSEVAGTTWSWTWLGDVDQMAAGIRLDISDPNNPAGYVEMGYLEIAARGEVTRSFSWGSEYGFRRRSQQTEAIGGAIYIDRRDAPRVFRGTFKAAPRIEALTRHFEMLRQLDADGVVVWIPHPDEPQHWPRTTMLARLVDPGLQSYVARGYDDVPISLEEVIG